MKDTVVDLDLVAKLGVSVWPTMHERVSNFVILKRRLRLAILVPPDAWFLGIEFQHLHRNFPVLNRNGNAFEAYLNLSHWCTPFTGVFHQCRAAPSRTSSGS